MVLLGDLYGPNRTLFREKTMIFGAPWLKKGPHRRFGGRNLLPILDSENMASKEVSHFSGSFFIIFIHEMNKSCQNTTNLSETGF